MRIRTLLGLVAGVLCASAWAGESKPADDPNATNDLRAPVRWRVGETVTERESSATHSTVTVRRGTGPEREMPGGDTSQKTTVVRRCLELGADGRPSKMLLYVKEWRMAGAGPEDRSLEQAVLELGRDGWKLLTHDIELTPRARAWLLGDLLSPTWSGELGTMALLPTASAAPGDEWKPGADTSIAHLFSKLGIDPGGEGVSIRCTLKSLDPSPDGATARIEYDAEAEPPSDAAETTAKRPVCAVHLTGFLAGTAGAWHRTLSSSTETDVDISGERDGAQFLLVAKSTSTSAHSEGGEIPSWDPAPPDEDETLCTFVRATVGAGDVFTEEGSDEFTVTTRAEDCACAPCPAPEESSSTDWTIVRRVVEAGADGRASRERVFVKSWTHTEKDATDTSLAGAWFDVTTEGWKLDGDVALTGAATNWIRSRTPAGKDADAPLVPATSGPARVGTIWMLDTAAVAKSSLWDAGLQLEPDHATGRCKIVEAEESEGQVAAKVRYHTETPVSGVLGVGENRVRALTGSEVKVSGSAQGPLSSWGGVGERRTEIECSIHVQHDDVVGRLATIRKLWLEVRPGGEFPEAPK